MPNVTVTLSLVECHKTTELGHDELYVAVGAVNPDGSQNSNQCPGKDKGDAGDDNSCWDLNDRGPLSSRKNLPSPILYSSDLPEGKALSLALVFCEQDGGGVQEAVAIAGQAVDALGKSFPIVTIIGNVLDLLSRIIPKNRDDVLGGVKLTLSQSGGQLSAQVDTDGPRSWPDQAAWNQAAKANGWTNGCAVQLTGDGGNYKVYLTYALV